jgi:hypothetical protein
VKTARERANVINGGFLQSLSNNGEVNSDWLIEAVEAQIAEAVADERERCAKFVEGCADMVAQSQHPPWHLAASMLIGAIASDIRHSQPESE